MDKIIKKVYYKIEFTLESPLALGSGDNYETDKDLMKDSRGIPYIPASSIAGVCRERIRSKYDEEKAASYFGDVVIKDSVDEEEPKETTGNNLADKRGTSERDRIESRLLFYDALIRQCDNNNSGKEPDNKIRISVRDSVALDEYKTAIKGAKFDMEVLEPGIRFVTYIEQNHTIDGDQNNEENDDIVKDIVSEFLGGNISFGAKTTRGYGRIGNAIIYRKEFDFTDEDIIKDWLSWDMYEDDAFNNPVKETVIPAACKEKKIILTIKQKGGISVRKYSTRVSEDKKKKPEPDYEQLTVKRADDNTIYPVIPGTTWGGAFRHRMKEIGIKDKELARIFGFVKKKNTNNSKDDNFENDSIDKNKKNSQRSVIGFYDTMLKNAKEKQISRNAIDRFSGGTKDGALYTERTYYGGTGKLVISIPNIGLDENREKNDQFTAALAAAITDLHFGLLSVGGLTTVGRGLFEIEEINGKALKDIDGMKNIDFNDPTKTAPLLFNVLKEELGINSQADLEEKTQ